MLVLDNKVTAAVLTMPDVVRALEESYQDLAEGVGVCRPRIDLNLPVDDTRVYRWGTMEGGSPRSAVLADLGIGTEDLTRETYTGAVPAQRR